MVKIMLIVFAMMMYVVGSNIYAYTETVGNLDGAATNGWISFEDRSGGPWDPDGFGQTFTTPTSTVPVTLESFTFQFMAGSPWPSFTGTVWRIQVYASTNRTTLLGEASTPFTLYTYNTKYTVTVDFSAGISINPGQSIYCEIKGTDSHGQGVAYQIYYNNSNPVDGAAYESDGSVRLLNGTSDLNFEAVFDVPVLINTVGNLSGGNLSGYVSFGDRSGGPWDPDAVGQTLKVPTPSYDGALTFNSANFQFIASDTWPAFTGAVWRAQVYASTNKTTLIGEVSNPFTLYSTNVRYTVGFDFGSSIRVTPGQDLYFEIEGTDTHNQGVAYKFYFNAANPVDGVGYLVHDQSFAAISGLSDLNFEAVFHLTPVKGTIIIIK